MSFFALFFISLLCFTPALLAPTENRKTSFTLRGPVKDRHLLRRSDGTVTLSDLTKEASHVLAKYHRNFQLAKANIAPKKLKPRTSTGYVELQDYSKGAIDLEYYFGVRDGPISMGRPAQRIPIIFDTGSSDLVVPIKCPACEVAFHPKESSTYKSTGEPFDTTYGYASLAVTGEISTDIVSVGGLTVTKFHFGAVEGEFIKPAAGVMGMAFPWIAQTGEPSFVHTLALAGTLSSNLFSFDLRRQPTTGSSLTIGAIAGHRGEPRYTPVTSQTYWEVQSDGFVVGNGTKGPPFLAAIDTGTTLITVPSSVAKSLYEQIPGSSIDQVTTSQLGKGIIYQFPCSATLPTVALTFAGVAGTFPINPPDLNTGSTADDPSLCIGSIMGVDRFDNDENIYAVLGDA